MAEEEDEREDFMDLDLNLEPDLEISIDSPPSSHISSIDERIRRLEEVTRRSRHRWRRFIRTPSPTPSPTPPPPPRQAPNPMFHIGQGSGSPEERRSDQICTSCKGKKRDLIAEALNSKDDGDGDGEKESDGNSNSNGSASGFFDCNVCFDMASDPVLTSCGHLFCWPCLYQWIHVHSQAKECPVCKGEVTDTNITPIYGRGGEDDSNKEKNKEEGGVKVPPRPKGRRVESLRQSVRRVDSSFSVQEIIQRIGSASRILNVSEMVSIGHAPSLTPDEVVVAPIQNNNAGSSNSSRRVLRSSSQRATSQRTPDLQRGSSSQRGSTSQRGGASSSNHLFSALTSAERLIQFFGNPMRRNESQSQSVEDRDSVSSIAAPSPGASMDIDSFVSLHSSDGSRVSDVETGVRRTRRRRRLN